MSWTRDSKEPRRIAWRVMIPNQVSIWLIHELPLGVHDEVVRNGDALVPLQITRHLVAGPVSKASLRRRRKLGQRDNPRPHLRRHRRWTSGGFVVLQCGQPASLVPVDPLVHRGFRRTAHAGDIGRTLPLVPPQHDLRPGRNGSVVPHRKNRLQFHALLHRESHPRIISRRPCIVKLLRLHDTRADGGGPAAAADGGHVRARRCRRRTTGAGDRLPQDPADPPAAASSSASAAAAPPPGTAPAPAAGGRSRPATGLALHCRR
jgi:hypothetical protein